MIKKSLFLHFQLLGSIPKSEDQFISNQLFKESRLGEVSCLLCNWFISVLFHM